MIETRFEWDENKNLSNKRKHGIRFEQAILAFRDPLVVSRKERIESGEQRWQTFGMVEGLLLLLVAHTIREDLDEEVIRIISARPATRKEGESMKTKMVSYTLETLPPLSEKDRTRLKALAARPDSEIDTSDIPEWTDAQWKHAVRGKFYRPCKKQITAKVDADVLDWLKSEGKRYQSRMNAILRREMLANVRRG